MKKTYLLLKLLLLIASVNFAQTNVSGGITTNTTWGLVNSPYIVTNDIVIFENKTLTIEPGVTVKFNDGVQLRVQGTIIAKGNHSNKIKFTSNSPSPQKKSWKEIKIELRARYIFDYTTFEYAYSAIHTNHAISSSIKNSIFQHNYNGIEADSGGPQWGVTIENTKFINNDKGIANYHDEVNLKNCEFKNNRIGAELTESNVNSCIFDGNTDTGLFANYTKLTNSTFINNKVAIDKNFLSISSFTSEMTGNTIKNNSTGVRIGYFETGINVSNNTIYNNSKFDVINTGSNEADFSNNCWGTEDLNEIENHIYHGIDDINFGLVNFTSPTTGCPDSTTDAVPILPNQSVSTDEDIKLNIDLEPTDPDSDQFSYKIVSYPTNGYVYIRNNTATYTPFQNFNGSDNFTITANDGQYTSNTANISITVNAVNDPPTANNDYIKVDEGATVTTTYTGVSANATTLLYNDSDTEGDPFTASIVSEPTHGSLTLNSDGTFSYEHNGSETTSDRFSYKTNDGEFDSNVAFVHIIINPINNNSPTDIILSNQSIEENSYQRSFVGLLSSSDIDLPSDNHTFEFVSGVGDDNNTDFYIYNNNYLYTSNSFDYEEQESLTIRIKTTDENNQSFERSLEINITNINDIDITYDTTGYSSCAGNSGTGEINITQVNETSGDITYNWSASNGGVIPYGQENIPNLTELVSGRYHLSITDDYHTFYKNFEILLTPQYNDLSICYVSSDDSEVTKNRIYIDNKGSYNVAFYEILRETNIANVYTTIGTIPSNENSFLDETSNNITQSYNYKVRSISNCGITSSNSSLHKTILLQSSVAVNQTVNLNWSHYEGTDVTTYNIYRKTNLEEFQLIGSVSSNSNSFNDITADVANNTYEYYISVQVDPCFTNQTNAKISLNTTEIKSNHQSLGHSLSFNNNLDLNHISIYPNPAKSELNIELNSEITLVKSEIYNTLGQVVMEAKTSTFSIENIPPSTYFIKIITSKGVGIKSFIKR
ncbi:Ig-like domain-containing protein [Wenyingzhuangia sp. IMCC45467]